MVFFFVDSLAMHCGQEEILGNSLPPEQGAVMTAWL